MGDVMVKRVMMIAYHYPPARISSGIQRTLKFSDYLRDHGWTPSVLSVHPRAYARVSDDQCGEIPPDIVVRRACALDSGRHLAIGGRYPLVLALPDRWASWVLGGVWAGLDMIRKWRPTILWSTYPIATAHLIGLVLNRLTGIPWVADCRDSMTEPGYPTPPARRKVYQWLERNTVARAARVVFTAPSTWRMYADRYSALPASKWAVVTNGYDEDNFSSAERGPPGALTEAAITLVHSGSLYPSERDPRPFFAALAELKRQGRLSERTLKVRLRATGHDEIFRPLIEAANIADLVSLEPSVGYREALSEMLRADGLLLFQASNSNHQVPAKLFEYLRARKPILALADRAGDTARIMLQAGVDSIVDLEDPAGIERELQRFIDLIGQGAAPVASDESVACYSRREKAAELAALLDEVVAEFGSAAR
ncbi:MAG: glycosyltransferase [Gammaproteobacteria bacterium]